MKPPTAKWYRTAALLCICCSMAACGYHLQVAGKPVGTEIPSLAIPMVESTSSALGFEGDFTTVIREEFIQQARIPLVSEDVASAVLRGQVVDVRTLPLGYSVDVQPVDGGTAVYEQTNSRWLIIEMTAELVDAATGEVIWEAGRLQEKASFAVDADPVRTRYNQRIATAEIARLLARRLYQKTMERF